MASRLGEAQLRRRQALEINDNVVQGLVAAAYALDQGQMPDVASLPRADPVRGARDDGRPPRAARRRGPPARRPGPATPAAIGVHRRRRRPPTQEETLGARTPHRVLVVDDADDLRDAAARRGWRRATGSPWSARPPTASPRSSWPPSCSPTWCMLDLAMPRMDGLEALPLIRAAVPGRARDRALAASTRARWPRRRSRPAPIATWSRAARCASCSSWSTRSSTRLLHPRRPAWRTVGP